MGREDLIGNSKKHLIPRENFRTQGGRHQRFLTQHTGLPPSGQSLKKSKANSFKGRGNKNNALKKRRK